MKDNDSKDELKKLLEPLRSLTPNNLQTQKWQNAVKDELTPKSKAIATTRSKWMLQLVAAMFVGAVFGALLMKTFLPPATNQNSFVAQISSMDATFEHSHTNLD